MQLKVKMKLNTKNEIEAIFDGKTLAEVVKQASVLLDFEGKCAFCDSEDITLNGYSTKENYSYTQFVCRACGARRVFGQYKDSTGYFLKDWEEKPQFNKSDNK